MDLVVCFLGLHCCRWPLQRFSYTWFSLFFGMLVSRCDAFVPTDVCICTYTAFFWSFFSSFLRFRYKNGSPLPFRLSQSLSIVEPHPLLLPLSFWFSLICMVSLSSTSSLRAVFFSLVPPPLVRASFPRFFLVPKGACIHGPIAFWFSQGLPSCVLFPFDFSLCRRRSIFMDLLPFDFHMVLFFAFSWFSCGFLLFCFACYCGFSSIGPCFLPSIFPCDDFSLCRIFLHGYVVF